MVNTALPSLRVVALVYTGLSAIAGFVLLVGVALAPKAPILQRVAEPAGEAVTRVVQPTTDMISTFVAPPAAPPVALAVPTAAPTSPPFVDATKLNVVIDQPSTPVVVREEPRAVHVALTPEPTLDEQPVTDDQAADEVDVPVSEDLVVAAPQEAPAMREASVEPPKPLPTPTVVVPTTPQQVKAQVDAANQAAIDAARAQTAQLKAAADAANQVAIDALKRANAPALADSAVALPIPTAKQSAEASKLAAEKAKAEADAANQAAIDAAKALKATH